MPFTYLNTDCFEWMQVREENSITAIVTDPPYGVKEYTAEEIEKFCTTKYNITFPLFEKLKVNGDDAHPLYQYLKSALPLDGKNDIRWNFEKFLIGKDGKPARRYSPKTKPAELAADIEALLK